MHAATSPEYHDRWIDCTDQELRIRGYYFPWGTKRIPLRQDRRGAARQDHGPPGKGRVWGTAKTGIERQRFACPASSARSRTGLLACLTSGRPAISALTRRSAVDMRQMP